MNSSIENKRYKKMYKKFVKLNLQNNIRHGEKFFGQYRLETIKNNIDNFDKLNKDFIQKEFIELNNHIMNNIEEEYKQINIKI